MFYPRNIFPALKQHLENKQVTVLTGMRRTGKTTLVKQLMAESSIRQKAYFDLERMDNRLLFSEANYENIIARMKQEGINFSERFLVAIDEIQLVPNLPSVIMYLYDNYDIKFLITGSNAYRLKDILGKTLAERKEIFELYPLTFHELLTFKGIPFVPQIHFTKQVFIQAEYERLKFYYEEYIQYGGFPEVVLFDKISDKKDMILDILSSFMNIDVRLFTDFKKSTEIYQLIKLLAVRVGTKLDIAKLTSVTNLPRAAVDNYLSLFEESYLIKTIPVTAISPEREIVKAKKIYFLDNGIASISADLSSGAKFENAIFNQLNALGDLSYYQLKTGKEIDFILDKEKTFEVKETATLSDLKNLQYLAKNLNIEENFVIGRHPNQQFDGFLWGGFIG